LRSITGITHPGIEGYTASPNKSGGHFPMVSSRFPLKTIHYCNYNPFISSLWYSMVISSPVLGMIGIMGQQQEFLIVTLLGFSKSCYYGFQENEPDEPVEPVDKDHIF
jgi:hypothetical protein